MNQILQIENKKSKGPVEINKVVIFFGVAIIIFAIMIIGIGSYIMLSKDNKQEQGNTIQESTKPVVNINRDADDIIVEVTHNLPISKIVYSWNDGEEKTIDGGNRTTLSEKISLPYGTNTLKLTVIDINSEETKFQKEYVVDGEGKPVIELKLTQDNKIKIVVQDNNNLQYVEYAWNNDEPKRVNANENDLTKIEEEVEIPVGQNTLKVQAVNVNNNATTKELEVKGVKKPVVTLKKEDGKLVIRAEDEAGMKIINYKLNGQRYQINYGNKKLIEYRQEIPAGDSKLELTAENQDGGTTTVKAIIKN